MKIAALSFSLVTLFFSTACTEPELQRRQGQRANRFGYNSTRTDFGPETTTSTNSTETITSTETTVPRETAVASEVSTTAPVKDLPYGIKVEGQPNQVKVPYPPFPIIEIVDENGKRYAPGSEVEDPVTHKHFLVP